MAIWPRTGAQALYLIANLPQSLAAASTVTAGHVHTDLYPYTLKYTLKR